MKLMFSAYLSKLTNVPWTDQFRKMLMRQPPKVLQVLILQDGCQAQVVNISHIPTNNQYHV